MEYIWHGGAYLFKNFTDLVAMINAYAQSHSTTTEAIYCVYMIPEAMIEYDEEQAKYSGQLSPKEVSLEFDKPTEIEGYIPKNKKLLTYPYNCLVFSNNSGSSNVLKYEYFSGNKATFKIKGVPTVGGSIKCIPTTYNRTVENEEEGIVAGKFPTLNWSDDAYVNWLTEQSINLSQGLQGAGVQMLVGGVVAAAGQPAAGGSMAGQGIGNIGSSLFNYVQAKQLHELTPNTAKGNINCGDINVCSRKNGFYFINKTIKREFAEIIDDYFTRMGYQINRLKTPNIATRSIFNYVQVAQSDEAVFGEIPSNHLKIINDIFKKGVTIWHSHSNIGNYTIENDII